MRTILLISPYWKEEHRWMVSSYKLADLWQRGGNKVIVACMGSSNRVEEVSNTLTIHYRKDFFLPDPWNYGIAPGFAFHVLKLAKQLKPDVIVVNKVLFWTSISLLLLRLTGRRVILLTDALVGMTWWPRGTIARVCAAIYAWTLGWLILCAASRVVFFHPQPQKLLRFLRLTKKSSVIPTGIDPTPYTAEKKNSDNITVTYVGRLESVKGVDDFLAALAPLVPLHPYLSVQVVGWYKPGHPLVAQYEDRVKFVGRRDDIPKVLEGTDIFVLPSYSEGLSNALMEAMASGCACVATAVGGNNFLMDHGRAGLLFFPGDRKVLAVQVEHLLADRALRTKLSHAARKRIEEHFSWTHVSGEYERLFQQFLLPPEHGTLSA